jgi:hypothetical protein
MKVADDIAVTFTPKDSAPPIRVLTANISPASGAALGASGKIGFKFDTTTKGEYIITFDIPVVGFDVYDDPATNGGTPSTNSGLKDAITWHIHGGTIITPSGYQPLAASGEEGVALLVTPSPFKMVKIKIEPVDTW